VKFSRKLLEKRVRRHINISQSHWMFEVSASLEHACLQSLTKVLDISCHRFLRKVIPDHIQVCLKLLSCWWLTCPACDRLSAWHPAHDNHAVLHIKIWRVWWPCMLRNEVIAVASNQSCVACAVSWSAILLTDKTIGHQWGSVFDKFRN